MDQDDLSRSPSLRQELLEYSAFSHTLSTPLSRGGSLPLAPLTPVVVGSQSWMHTFLKSLDRATLVAFTAVNEDAHAHDSILSYLWGPFGLWRRRQRHQRIKPRLSPDL